MGLFYQGITFSQFSALLLLIAVLLGVNEWTRRNKYVSIAVFCVLPVLLALGVYAGFLGSPSGKTWFGWVKVISALAGVYGFMLIRFTGLGKKKFAAFFPLAILALNIAEAVYREFEVFSTYKVLTVDAAGITILGGPWNILNALAGVICIITLTGFVGIRVSKDKTQDMIWPDMTWLYILGYTVWNFAYVYNCISTRSIYSGFAILLAAVIAEAFFKQGAWLQHRAQILSLYAMFALSVDFTSVSYYQILPTYNESLLLAFSVLSFLINAGVLGSMVYQMLKHKKNPLTQEIYTESAYYKKTMAVNKLS